MRSRHAAAHCAAYRSHSRPRADELASKNKRAQVNNFKHRKLLLAKNFRQATTETKLSAKRSAHFEISNANQADIMISYYYDYYTRLTAFVPGQPG